jgi:hypothetical protein
VSRVAGLDSGLIWAVEKPTRDLGKMFNIGQKGTFFKDLD